MLNHVFLSETNPHESKINLTKYFFAIIIRRLDSGRWPRQQNYESTNDTATIVILVRTHTDEMYDDELMISFITMITTTNSIIGHLFCIRITPLLPWQLEGSYG